jgi:ribosomal protein L37AE/L43A
MKTTYLDKKFYNQVVVTHDDYIQKIVNELTLLNTIHRTIENVPKYYTKLINKSKEWVWNKTPSGEVYYWPDQDRNFFNKIMNFKKYNFGRENVETKKFKQAEEYFGKVRECKHCNQKYRIRDNLGWWDCNREFVSGPYRKYINAMHTDGIETKYGVLKIPFFAFIILNVNIPRRNAIKIIVVEPIDKQDNQNICLTKSRIHVYVTEK